MDLLITAFTGFGRFAVNPSVEIARRLHGSLVAGGVDPALEMLEVRYAAADALVARLAAAPPRRWLMVGVAGNAHLPRVERVARNSVGVTPDVGGTVLGPREIDVGGPGQVVGGLFDSGQPAPTGTTDSHDAGDYLCNYLYWRGCTRLPTRCGFLHVVPAEVTAVESQGETALRVVEALCGG